MDIQDYAKYLLQEGTVEEKREDDLNSDEFIPYDPGLIQNYTEIPEVTIEYYKERIIKYWC